MQLSEHLDVDSSLHFDEMGGCRRRHRNGGPNVLVMMKFENSERGENI